MKGLLGKCGCTRMVQGGYNVALAAGDSVERHFMDTIEGGKWLTDQDLAWTLVTKAVERIHELENELGCFFDRNPDGTVHQKAFAGQTFDRTVHKGDLTGIEIINRLAEQVWARGIDRLEEHRALELITAADGAALAGVLMIDMRNGELRLRAGAGRCCSPPAAGRRCTSTTRPRATRPATAWRWRCAPGCRCATWRWCSSIPTGLLAGAGTRMTGTVLEEGLRGAGGYLLERRQASASWRSYDPRGERATRDIVSRAIYRRDARRARRRRNGGVYIADGAPRPGQRAPRSSRAWSSAAPIAASTSPAAWSRSCRPRTT